MVLHGQLLGEVPQLSQVWQQVRASVDGETDIELHSMFERLMSETRATADLLDDCSGLLMPRTEQVIRVGIVRWQPRHQSRR
jgi:hypothetical protein